MSHNPQAGFTPVTPVGDAAILSLVPPIARGDSIRHPDPLSAPSGEQQPLPTSPQIPVAPVRRRRPVTPLIQLPGGSPLSAALQVAPLIPGQPVAAPQVQPLPSAYGVQPTSFPFPAAPPFNIAQPPYFGMMPQPLPMQMFVAYVMLMPMPAPQPYWPQPHPQQAWPH